MAAARTKNLPDVKLCHTLSTIQTKNLRYVKLSLNPSDWTDWLLKNKNLLESLARKISR